MLSDRLRDIAADLRKMAAQKAEEKQVKVASHDVELDPEKVRDFLVFFGARS